jgi:hypothetical protein
MNNIFQLKFESFWKFFNEIFVIFNEYFKVNIKITNMVINNGRKYKMHA